MGRPACPESEAILCAFAAALTSYKVDTVCRPRPPGIGIEDLRQGVHEILSGLGASAQATSVAGFLDERYQQRIATGESLQYARAAYEARALEISAKWRGTPHIVLHIAPPQRCEEASSPTVWAYHGTKFENFWSILNCGLINAAQVDRRLALTGSLFGRGIYLSRDPSYAGQFARMSSPLPGLLGRWSCLLLCEVTPGPMVTIGPDTGVIDRVGEISQCPQPSETTYARAKKDAHSVPDGVIVVEDSAAVVIRSAILHRLDAPAARTCRLSPELIVGIVVVVTAIAHKCYHTRGF